MSSLKRPKPETTLAIILGASEWPYYAKFQTSPSFKKSAEDFREYLLDENGFGLPRDNLYYSFNADKYSPEIIIEISQFLHERLKQSLGQEQLPKDLIVYYVGHGGFRESTADYYLAVKSTQPPDLYSTGIAIRSLAKAINEDARWLRHYIILDSCFSAAACGWFQSDPNEVAYQKIIEVLPEKGTALLCSTSIRDPSEAPPDLKHTMFTGALIEALRQGNENSPKFFSIQDLHHIIYDIIRKNFESRAIRPEIHDPEQRQGYVSEVPLFPNPAKCNLYDSQQLLVEGYQEPIKRDLNEDYEPVLAGDGKPSNTDDPIITLDKSFEKSLGILQKLKRSVAEVTTSKKRVQLEDAKLQMSIDKLDAQAEEAHGANREDLARTALENKAVLEAQSAVLGQQIANLENQINQLIGAQSNFSVLVTDLSNKMVMIRGRLDNLDNFQDFSLPGDKSEDKMQEKKDKLEADAIKIHMEFIKEGTIILDKFYKALSI